MFEYENAKAAREAERKRMGVTAGAYEEEPTEIALYREQAKSARAARRWVCFGDLLNLFGRYLHETYDVEVGGCGAS